MTAYRFTTDDASFPVDAQTAGEELDRIRVSYGTLQPAAVVDESRPEDAPLHPCFEWDDETAAEKYREHQATTIIRSVRVVCDQRAAKPQPVHLLPEVPSDEVEIEDYDPLAFELRESVGAVIQAKRLVEVLRQKALSRFDNQKRIAANVALAELAEAEQDLVDAHEALVSARQESTWERQPVGQSVH